MLFCLVKINYVWQSFLRAEIAFSNRIFKLYFYFRHCYSCPHPPTLCQHLPSLQSPFPLAITTLLSVSLGYTYKFSGNPFTFYLVPHIPPPSNSSQSALCVSASVSILFISLFCLFWKYKTGIVVLEIILNIVLLLQFSQHSELYRDIFPIIIKHLSTTYLLYYLSNPHGEKSMHCSQWVFN